MANTVGMMRFNGSSSLIHGGRQDHSMAEKNVSRRRLRCRSYTSSSSSHATQQSHQLMDQYRTLQLQPGASESEVKKAFRRLALQYHPDVCKGSDCGVQFHQINEAYDIVMSNLRGESTTSSLYDTCNDVADEDESMGGIYDPEDMWEEWMGWEGAGIRDYSSHINPYI